MADDAQEGPSPPPSILAALLTVAALLPGASAVLSARPEAAGAVNAATSSALDAVRQALQDTSLPPALPAPPAHGASGFNALGAPRGERPANAALHAVRQSFQDQLPSPGLPVPSAPGEPRAVAHGAPRGDRSRRASLIIQQKQLTMTQVDDKVRRAVLAQRHGISKWTIHISSARRREVRAAAAACAPFFARCVQPCRFPLLKALLFEWFLRIRSMGRTTIPLSRLALSAKPR